MLNGMPGGFSMTSTTLRSSRILGEMEVDEPWLGLWLPLNYQVDMGASQHKTLELG